MELPLQNENAWADRFNLFLQIYKTFLFYLESSESIFYDNFSWPKLESVQIPKVLPWINLISWVNVFLIRARVTCGHVLPLLPPDDRKKFFGQIDFLSPTTKEARFEIQISNFPWMLFEELIRSEFVIYGWTRRQVENVKWLTTCLIKYLNFITLSRIYCKIHSVYFTNQIVYFTNLSSLFQETWWKTRNFMHWKHNIFIIFPNFKLLYQFFYQIHN